MLYVGSIWLPITCCLSQSLNPIGFVIFGSVYYGFGGEIGGGTGIGSKVSGVIIGGGIIGGGGGGVGYVLEPNKQHNKPNKPNNPNNPGHHFQQSLLCSLSITTGAGAGVTGLSITITLVFGAFCGMGCGTGLSI